MLREFISQHRSELLALCASKAAGRYDAEVSDGAEFGTPVFVDCLVACLEGDDSHHISLDTIAARHGAEMLDRGLPVDWLIHEYGDICQAVTELAALERLDIPAQEFGALNACLDNAIAASVVQYEHQRELALMSDGSHEVHERIGRFADELRELIDETGRALTLLKNDHRSGTGAAASLDRSLGQLREAVDRKLAEIRVESGMVTTQEAIAVNALLTDLEPWGHAEAGWAGCTLSVSAGSGRFAVRADRPLLLAALKHLVRTALRATPRGGVVHLRARGTASRVQFEVEDACGGMTHAQEVAVSRILERPGAPLGAIGLDRAISKRNAEELGGRLRLRVHAGAGCIFAIELPRYVTEHDPAA